MGSGQPEDALKDERRRHKQIYHVQTVLWDVRNVYFVQILFIRKTFKFKIFALNILEENDISFKIFLILTFTVEVFRASVPIIDVSFPISVIEKPLTLTLTRNPSP